MTDLDIDDVSGGTLYVRMTGGGIVRAEVKLVRMTVDDEEDDGQVIVEALTVMPFKVVRQANPSPPSE